MSAKHLIQLRCDYKYGTKVDQPQLYCYTVRTVQAASFSRARLIAQDSWSHKDGKDYCPEHREGSQ